ncbi:hypothetical protein Y032_0349g3186 [Ancylostoma ceylanicum]|uniref:Uncharacterized protein n=1 Tax=Ancylostoma ceylanicum TaxID=53326 RepID=A0A016RXV7_9BILA|nr:hypothetical protein Y032_0349g3186 [Ancylostoma ceylanicum]
MMKAVILNSTSQTTKTNMSRLTVCPRAAFGLANRTASDAVAGPFPSISHVTTSSCNTKDSRRCTSSASKNATEF